MKKIKQSTFVKLLSLSSTFLVLACAACTIASRLLDNSEQSTAIANALAVVVYVLLGLLLVNQIAVVLYAIKGFIAPLKKIENKMREFSAGDLSNPIDVPEDNTEMGVTAQAINEFRTRQHTIISDVAYVLGEMGDGNFTVDTRCADEYVGDNASILSSMRKIAATLRSNITEISNAIDQVDSGAAQVSSASVSLSQGATEQAASIQELSANINVISKMINVNAGDAAEASEKTNYAGVQLGNANEKMSDLVAAMNEIRSSSDETKNIIKTIEDIAFQTNILALNAAVEAARAGEAGKGFAVVADEVRNLASKSAEAAQNTTELIEGTVAAIDRGNSLVTEVADDMTEVYKAASLVAEINAKIAGSSKEAADSISQVTVGVEQISSVVQTNSATAEQTAAASEELSAQSDTCKHLISQFVIRD